jgi:hypothetical protein
MKMISKSLLKNLIKQEQLRLPLEGEPETTPEQKIVKDKVKKKAPVDKRIMEAWSGTKVHEILNERNKPLSGRELYAYLTSQNFDHQSHRDVTRLFEDNDAEKNIPEQSAQIALDFANDLIKRPDADANKKKRAERVLTTLLRHSKLPSSTYEKILSSKDNPYTYEDNDPELSQSSKDYMKNDRVLDVSRNRHLKENHHLMAVENHPEYINELLTNNDEIKNNERLVNHILSKDHIFNKMRDDRIYDIAKWHNENLHPNNAKRLMEHPSFEKGITHHEPLDKLLDKLTPEDRKSFIDKKLGIEGGNAYDPEREGEDHWDNWTGGEGYSKTIAKLLPRSKHLDDSHAEHIKRHGDFNQKYDMYHYNKDIDPRHGIEMFNKWKNDDDHHGYSASELNEANRENFDDVYTHEHLPDEVKEEILQSGWDSGAIDEHAEDIFPYSDYLEGLDDDKVLEIMGKDHDDDDEIHDKMIEEYHWNGENPKAQTSHEHYDRVEKFLENNNTDTDLETFTSETGLHPSDLGIGYDEESDTVDRDEVENYFNEQLGGAREIDYADHPELTIHDHPDYDERYNEAANEWRLDHWRNDKHNIADSNYLYEAHREHPDYEEAMEEAKKDYLENNSSDHVAELYDNSHEEPEFIPEHLHPHMPELEQFREQKKRKVRDGGHSNFFNTQIPERGYEHEYGENQHHYELAKDYADAKGGNIDIGTLHKVFPNQKEIWKGLFGDKGKMSSEEIQSKINDIPKTKYDISYSKWDKNKIQNTNNQDEVVFRLDHSDESINAIKQNPEVFKTFEKVQELSHRSGHPTNKNTIAWARVDFTDPKNPMISELQSDYGKTVREYLKNNNEPEKAAHIQEIENHHKNWRENLLNFVIKTAKKHGAEKIFTHSPESKAKHTGSDTTHSVYLDSYKKVPRNMGFKPVEMNEMPLTNEGKDHFIEKQSETPSERSVKHEEAIQHHLSFYNGMIRHFNDTQQPHFERIANEHKNMAQKHLDEWSNLGSLESYQLNSPQAIEETTQTFEAGVPHVIAEKVGVNDKMQTHKHDSLIGQPLESTKTLQGHVLDLKPQVMKKNIDLANTLIKAETLLVKKHMQNQDVRQDIININLIKEMLGYDNL